MNLTGQVAERYVRDAMALDPVSATLSFVSGHGEGWALYAERLMDELGYLDDPGNRLGMLDQQLLHAAQVVIDIGVHLELPVPPGTGWHDGQAWNAGLAWEFLRSHSRYPD